MKRVLLLIGVIFALCSCGEKQPSVDVEKEIKKTVTENLKKRMKNPDSFKIEYIDIKKDTVPYYFDRVIFSDIAALSEASDDYERYSGMSDYWEDERRAAARQMLSLSTKMLNAIEVAKYENSTNPIVDYIVCLKASGENSFGATVSSRYICVVDSNDLSNVLCVYDLDNDFIEAIAALMVFDEDFKARLSKDRFGNYDKSKLTFVEQFILTD